MYTLLRIAWTVRGVMIKGGVLISLGVVYIPTDLGDVHAEQVSWF